MPCAYFENFWQAIDEAISRKGFQLVCVLVCARKFACRGARVCVFVWESFRAQWLFCVWGGKSGGGGGRVNSSEFASRTLP